MSQYNTCPKCEGNRFYKNGFDPKDGYKYQKYICKSCGHQETDYRVQTVGGVVKPRVNNKELSTLLNWIRLLQHLVKNKFDIKEISQKFVMSEQLVYKTLTEVGENNNLQRYKPKGHEEVKFLSFSINRNAELAEFEILIVENKIVCISTVDKIGEVDKVMHDLFLEQGWAKIIEQSTSKRLAYLRLLAFRDVFNFLKPKT